MVNEEFRTRSGQHECDCTISRVTLFVTELMDTNLRTVLSQRSLPHDLFIFITILFLLFYLPFYFYLIYINIYLLYFLLYFKLYFYPLN